MEAMTGSPSMSAQGQNAATSMNDYGMGTYGASAPAALDAMTANATTEQDAPGYGYGYGAPVGPDFGQSGQYGIDAGTGEQASPGVDQGALDAAVSDALGGSYGSGDMGTGPGGIGSDAAASAAAEAAAEAASNADAAAGTEAAEATGGAAW